MVSIDERIDSHHKHYQNLINEKMKLEVVLKMVIQRKNFHYTAIQNLKEKKAKKEGNKHE